MKDKPEKGFATENESEQDKLNDDKISDNTSYQNKESLSEKIEDGMDEIMATTQEFFYGEGKHDDIPVLREHPSGIKRINKVQTRRNFNKKILNKKVLKIVGIILLIALGVAIARGIIAALLMA